VTLRELLQAIAGITPVAVEDTFWRHCSLRWPELQGSLAGGRWSRPHTYPALYLGRPPESVIIEAHRHLVDVGVGLFINQMAYISANMPPCHR
jgi:hypothetical protein